MIKRVALNSKLIFHNQLDIYNIDHKIRKTIGLLYKLNILPRVDFVFLTKVPSGCRMCTCSMLSAFFVYYLLIEKMLFYKVLYVNCYTKYQLLHSPLDHHLILRIFKSDWQGLDFRS